MVYIQQWRIKKLYKFFKKTNNLRGIVSYLVIHPCMRNVLEIRNNLHTDTPIVATKVDLNEGNDI